MNYSHKLIPILQSIDRYSCPNSINLHCHTLYSDGSLRPEDLFNQANKNGLKHIAITDHHSIQAYKDIKSLISIHGLSKYHTKIWSGAEITGLLKGCLVHILALGFDINTNFLNPYLLGDSVKGNFLKSEEIISNIRKANGLSILAHPARYKIPFKEIILEAKNIGFDGVEVWYDYERTHDWRFSPFICESINDLVKEHEMLSTCGTDTHGMSLLRR